MSLHGNLAVLQAAPEPPGGFAAGREGERLEFLDCDEKLVGRLEFADHLRRQMDPSQMVCHYQLVFSFERLSPRDGVRLARRPASFKPGPVSPLLRPEFGRIAAVQVLHHLPSTSQRLSHVVIGEAGLEFSP